ncbi:MAG: hypothetical protein MI867_06490 [Pseudomonadales bacterium]|nr:hypothetical protein [Pseudomonadales bacterium]
MYAVIIRAEAGVLDDEYDEAIDRMKTLAFNEFGCKEFFSLMNGDSRVAISYWDSLEQIKSWRANQEHIVAQNKAKEKWYKSYRIQIVEVLREYEYMA